MPIMYAMCTLASTRACALARASAHACGHACARACTCVHAGACLCDHVPRYVLGVPRLMPHLVVTSRGGQTLGNPRLHAVVWADEERPSQRLLFAQPRAARRQSRPWTECGSHGPCISRLLAYFRYKAHRAEVLVQWHGPRNGARQRAVARGRLAKASGSAPHRHHSDRAASRATSKSLRNTLRRAHREAFVRTCSFVSLSEGLQGPQPRASL